MKAEYYDHFGSDDMICDTARVSMAQVGGDSLAEVSVTVFHSNFTISIWSV